MAEGLKQKLGFCLSPGESENVLHRNKPATNGITELWELLGGYETVSIMVSFPEASISCSCSVHEESQWREFYCSSSFSR